MKASLVPDFSCLSFPDQHHRARRNSVDLFTTLYNRKVVDVIQFNNERSFAINFEAGATLLFKMHGHRSNILLLEGDKVKEIFRNHLKSDFQIKPHELHFEINWSKDFFLASLERLEKVYFTLGPTFWAYVATRGFASMSGEQKWALFDQTLQEMETPRFYLIAHNDNVLFSLLPFGEIQASFNDPFVALNEFVSVQSAHLVLVHEKNKILHHLSESRKSAHSYIVKSQARLKELEGDDHYHTWGTLLMANLDQVRQGQEHISLRGLYPPHEMIEIKLKQNLSPQRNAEIYYRKGKNQRIEITKLRELIVKKEEELVKTMEGIDAIRKTSNLKELRRLAGGTGAQREKKEKSKALPYREFEFNGFRIWVGRDAESNDELTLKFTHKEDLWLHVRDVAGSHVVIKYQSGKTFPHDVINRAAELAAFYSKRKTDSLCPVTVTPKKFVRKRKGDPAGVVVVEREKMVMVEPKA